MMIESFIKKYWFVVLYLALYFIAINLVVLNRFWQFEAFYFDHGIYDSSLWQVAHGTWPIIDHIEDGFIRQFGDHFTPTMYLLTPLYLLTERYEPLLILENIFVTSSAFILFLIAARKVKSRLMVFALTVAYTLFIGLQNAIIANFHTELIAVLTLALALWAMDLKKWKLFWLFLLLTFGTKQNFAAIGVGLGIFLVFSSERKQGIWVIFASLAYYLFATKLAIPILGLRPYGYETHLYSLREMVSALFLPPIKLQTAVTTFVTFGFLPLFSLSFLPAIFQDFGTRFVFSTPARWDLGLHYNATLAVLASYGSILGVVFLAKFNSYRRLIWVHAIIIIALVLVLHRFIYHGPIGLVFNKDFYGHTANFEFLRKFTRSIPTGGLVMTQNNIAPYLTHSHNVMLLRDDYYVWNPHVIAIDTRQGQNPSNYWPTTVVNFLKLQKRLASDKNYKVKKISNEQLIYMRLE